MPEITVFADVTCPFAYVGLTRILAVRDVVGAEAPPLRVRAWPLEVVNGSASTGDQLAPKVAALRRHVAPDLFDGFDAARFPSTSRPALAAEHAAHAVGPAEGMAFSLSVRRHLFEDGADVGDSEVVASLLARQGLPQPTDEDDAAVDADHREGIQRGVQGSPHFFTPAGSFFCPTLDIRHDEGAYEVGFDAVGFQRFMTAAFG